MEVTEQIKVFQEFLEIHYLADLLEAVRVGETHFNIDFAILSKHSPELADLLLEQPEEVTKACELSLSNFDLPKEIKNFHIRFRNLPDQHKMFVRNIRSEHLNKLLVIEGTIRQKSDVRPQVTSARFECPSCGNVMNVLQLDSKFKEPSRCGCGRKGKFRLLSKELIDVQGIVLEEATKDLEGGAQPKRMNILLKQDLVSPMSDKKTNPGTTLQIVGVLKEIPIILRSGGQSTKYDLLIEANNIIPLEEDYSNIQIKPEEEEQIKKLSEDPKIAQKLAAALAPGIYGHQKIKEALILQFVGGVKKLKNDGVMSRGDIHILLIGDPGSGKTIHGDSKIVLSDGTYCRIKDFVEKSFKGSDEYSTYSGTVNSVPSLNGLGLEINNPITGLWKRKATALYKIKTKTGKELICTETNPLFTTSSGYVQVTKTKDLSRQDWIALPRKISLDCKEQTLSISGKTIVVTPAVARFFAYVLAESYAVYAPDKGKYVIEFTNTDDALLSDFASLSETLFGQKTKQYKNKSCKKIYFMNKNILKAFYSLEPAIFTTSFNKKIPSFIMRSPLPIISSFLAAFFECDGYVEKNKGVGITLASKEMIDQIQHLLLRFGIISHCAAVTKCATNTAKKTKRTYWKLFIYGTNARIFGKEIGFLSMRKNEALEKIRSLEENTNVDVIPQLSSVLKTVRAKLRMTQFQMNIPRSTYQHFERGDRNPSRTSLQRIVAGLQIRVCELLLVLQKADDISVFSNRELYNASQEEMSSILGCSQTLVSHYETNKMQQQEAFDYTTLKQKVFTLLDDEILLKQLNNLALLSTSNIFWDQIVSIEPYHTNEPYIYDLEVAETHNFIANSIYVHNSQLLKRAAVVAPKARFVSGKGVSGAGLTAAVVKDEFLQGWSLEAGAMVLANKGILMIDEMDKMTDEDRSAMHEGMEQQSFHYDTLFQFADGSEMKIGEYIESLFQKHPEKVVKGKDCFILKLSAFDKKMLTTDWEKIMETSIDRVSKHLAPASFIEINLMNGRKIIVTPEHPVFCIEQGKIITKEAKDITQTDWLPIPLNIPILGEEQLFNVQENEFYNARATQHIAVPMHNDKNFYKMIGYLLAEGSKEVNRGKPIGINFTNNDFSLIKDFNAAVYDVFKIHPYIQKTTKKGESCWMTRYVSRELFVFLEKTTPEALRHSREKEIPALCMKGRKEDIATMLSCMFEGDGHATKKQRTIRIGYTSTSKILCEQIQDLLLRFKVRSNLIEHKKVWKVLITGYENIFRFYHSIGFITKRKNSVIEDYVSSNNREIIRTVKDLIPNIQEEIITLLEKHNITLVGRNTLATMKHDYLKRKRNISRRHLQKIVVLLEKKTRDEDVEKVSFLKKLAFGEIGFESVRNVRTIHNHNQEWSYDITVEPHHTFVSQNMILHNTISISKANIQATLRCETTVLAAANPKLGRFDPYEPIAKQINMPPALINRFDLIFSIKDLPDKEKDEELAHFILTMHKKHETENVEIETELLRKYLIYARQKVVPRLTDQALEEIKEYYVKMRSSGSSDDKGLKAIPISARQLEALVRLSEACAKVRLSSTITRKDARNAINLLHYCLEQIGLDPETGKIDIDRISTGITTSERAKIVGIREIIGELEQKLNTKQIPIEEIIKVAQEKGLNDEKVNESIEKLKRSGDIFEPRKGFISRLG
ncbi:hypothetical protein HZC31_05055 [Candidatus Woesearchaeota archaeon]|nr:hypothetical protein [Candidatus Woesearchaeota archaeon]